MGAISVHVNWLENTRTISVDETLMLSVCEEWKQIGQGEAQWQFIALSQSGQVFPATVKRNTNNLFVQCLSLRQKWRISDSGRSRLHNMTCTHAIVLAGQIQKCFTNPGINSHMWWDWKMSLHLGFLNPQREDSGSGKPEDLDSPHTIPGQTCSHQMQGTK